MTQAPDPESPLAWERVPGTPEPLTERELSWFIGWAKRVLWSPPHIRQRVQEHLVNITPANFYSDVPLVADIEDSFEYRGGEHPPYADLFDETRMRDVLERLIPYAATFDAPEAGDRDAPTEFFWDNPAFSGLDALAYWSVLRATEPELVVEIGSGYSTLVADQAIRANGHGRIVSIEPYPKQFLHELDTVERIDQRRVQDIPLDELVALVEPADVLFIDSTHTVKIGSDCLRIYLQLLPRLQEPLLVHTHDVALPFGMPRKRALHQHIYWTEQYLLQALLLNDPSASVLFGSLYSVRVLQDLAPRFAGVEDPRPGGSLWYGLNGATL